MAGVDPATVHITGLRELRAAMRRAGPELVKELRTDLKAVGRTVVADVQQAAPRRSGRARGSVRVVSGGNQVYIKAGGARVPYWGWLDFGGVLRPTGGRRNTITRARIRGGRYIYPAIARNERNIVRAAERAFDRAKQRAGL